MVTMEVLAIYDDGTETLTNTDNMGTITTKGLIGVGMRYPPVANGTRYGHRLVGHDKYYFQRVFNTLLNDNIPEYAMWDAGSVRATVIECRGPPNPDGTSKEVVRENIKTNTFPSTNVKNGAMVSDALYTTANNRLSEWFVEPLSEV